MPGPKGGRLEKGSRDSCWGSIAEDARWSHCFCWVREREGLNDVVDVLRERGVRARCSSCVSSTSMEDWRVKFPIDWARLLWVKSPFVLLGDFRLFLEPLERNGLSDGVPEVLPRKRDISGLLSILLPSVEPWDLLNDSGDLPAGVTVAEMEDILGAALWEGVRWSSFEVI